MDHPSDTAFIVVLCGSFALTLLPSPLPDRWLDRWGDYLASASAGRIVVIGLALVAAYVAVVYLAAVAVEGLIP